MQPNYVARKSVIASIGIWEIFLVILFFPLLIILPFQILSIKSFRIEFYDDRVVTYSGVLNKRRKQTAFMGVASTLIEQSLFGQMFNYGNVKVDVVGVWDIDTEKIKDPAGLDAYLQTRIIAKTQTTQFVPV